MQPRPSFLLVAALSLSCLSIRAARADDPKPPEAPPAAAQPAERGYVGFTPQPAIALPDADRARLKVPATGGAVVVKVLPGGPAEKAGLKVGDILIKYAGQPVPETSVEAFDAFVGSFAKIATGVEVGDEVEIVVEREGKPLTMKAVAISMEVMQKAALAAQPGSLAFFSAAAAFLSPEERTKWNVKAEKALVAVRVLAGGPAGKAGLVNGDVLLKYAGKDFPSTLALDPAKPETTTGFEQALQAVFAGVKPGQEVEVVVERDGKPVTLKAVAIDIAAVQKLAQTEEDGERDE